MFVLIWLPRTALEESPQICQSPWGRRVQRSTASNDSHGNDRGAGWDTAFSAGVQTSCDFTVWACIKALWTKRFGLKLWTQELEFLSCDEDQMAKKLLPLFPPSIFSSSSHLLSFLIRIAEEGKKNKVKRTWKIFKLHPVSKETQDHEQLVCI